MPVYQLAERLGTARTLHLQDKFVIIVYGSKQLNLQRADGEGAAALTPLFQQIRGHPLQPQSEPPQA